MAHAGNRPGDSARKEELDRRGTTTLVSRSAGFDPRHFGGATFNLSNRLRRAFWNLCYVAFFRISPRPMHGWRALILRCFGAEIGRGCHVYPKAVIWAPWNLRLGRAVAIANDVEIYNPSPVVVDDYSVVSQGAFLCAASHAYRSWEFPLVTKPIVIGRHAWVAARAFIQMGISIGEGCVIGAGSVVTQDMPAWWVCAGNPCRQIKPYQKGLQGRS